jgi:hypothetical protein
MPTTRKTDKRKWRILYPLFFVFFSAFIVYAITHQATQSGKIKVRTYQVSEGWGYQVIVKDKVYIDQPFIPVLQGKKAFPDRKSASRAGNMVKQKLLNRELPALTGEDLKHLGLDTLENSN